MNILVVCQHYWPEPFNVDETCELLVEAGHSVTVVTGLPNYPDGEVYEGYAHGENRNENRNAVEIRRAWLVPRGKDLSGINKLKRVANYLSFAVSASSKSLLKNKTFDAVICIQYSPILMAVPAIKHAHRMKKPCIIYSYDLWPEDLLTGGMSRDGLPYKLMKRVSRRIYSAADVIAITSPGFEKYFKEELGLEECSYVYLPQYAEDQFVSLGRYEGRCPERKSTIDFVFAGNVGGNQGIESVVHAASLLKDVPEIKIHIVGSGSRLEDCINLSKKLEAQNIVFHGRQPLSAMPDYYSMADAMLLTLSKPANGSLVSRYTIPRKLQSYLAAGKPVVVSAEGTISEMADSFGFGLCSRPDCPEDLAETLRLFANMDSAQRNLLAENAKRTYEEEFTKSVFIGRLEHMLEEIV